MKLNIQLKKLAGVQLAVLEVLVGLMALIQITFQAGLIFAVPFAALTVFMVRYIYLTMMLPGATINDEFDFTLDKLTLRRKGKAVKEISMGYGLHVYRYAGLMRSAIVFSRRQLPQGEVIRAYKNDPEVIAVPYIPRKMPKLKKYHDKSARI